MGFDSTLILKGLDGDYATMSKILRILLIYDGVIVGVGWWGDVGRKPKFFAFCL